MFDSEKLNREVLNNEETFGKKTKKAILYGKSHK